MSNTSNRKIVLDVVQEKNGAYKAILPEAKISFANTSKYQKVTKAPLPNEVLGTINWAEWGEDDCLPTLIRQKIQTVPMASATINRLVAMMYGNGLVYYRNSDLQEGNTNLKRAYIPEVENFLRGNHIRTKWLMPQLADYRIYMNTFSEMILSKDKSKISGLYHKPAEFCRLARQNPKTLDIEMVYFSPDFALGHPPVEGRYALLPLFRWYDPVQFYSWLKKRKFIWHSKFETPGITYYARPWWIGLFRDGGWIDVAANIPKIIKAMQDNQISIKYQINIPENYFIARHPDWDEYTSPQKQAAFDNKVSEINDALVGVDNVMKAISSLFQEDETTYQAYGKIEVIAIDDKAKRDVWVPDSNAADAQIVQGLGLHPSQMGLAPEGGKMGAGSGSDQRESFNTGINLNTIDQEIVLEPLNYISDFNGWGVTFMIDHTHHTTTNKKESGLEESNMTVSVEE